MVLQVALDRAAKLVGRLAYNRAVKEAVRDAQVCAFLHSPVSSEQSCASSV